MNELDLKNKLNMNCTREELELKEKILTLYTSDSNRQLLVKGNDIPQLTDLAKSVGLNLSFKKETVLSVFMLNIFVNGGIVFLGPMFISRILQEKIVSMDWNVNYVNFGLGMMFLLARIIATIIGVKNDNCYEMTLNRLETSPLLAKTT